MQNINNTPLKSILKMRDDLVVTLNSANGYESNFVDINPPIQGANWFRIVATNPCTVKVDGIASANYVLSSDLTLIQNSDVYNADVGDAAFYKIQNSLIRKLNVSLTDSTQLLNSDVTLNFEFFANLQILES